MDQWRLDKIEKYIKHHVENARSNARGVLLVAVLNHVVIALLMLLSFFCLYVTAACLLHVVACVFF
jgi:hypothetical protein